MTLSLEIGQIDNRCQVLGSLQQAEQIGRDIQRLSSGPLTDALAGRLALTAAGRGSADAVIRIRCLAVKLNLSREQLDGTWVAQALAARLVEALDLALAYPSEEVKVYLNRSDYLAAFVTALLRGQAWQHWQYEEFIALREVEDQEAAVQIVLASRDELPSLVDALVRHQSLQLLQNSLRAEQAERLFRRWSGCSLSEVFSSVDTELDWHDPTAYDMCDQLRNRPLVDSTVTAVQLVLIALAKHSAPTISLAALSRLAARLCVLRHHAKDLEAYIAQPSAEVAALDASTSQLTTDDFELARIIAWIRRTPEQRAWVERIIARIAPKSDVQDQSVTHPLQSNYAAQPTQVVYVENAGVALLVPIIVSMSLDQEYPMRDLRRALAFCVDSSEDSLGWLHWLLPDETTPPTTPSVLSPALRLGLSPAQQQAVEAAAPEEQLSQLLLAHFAARLSGLQASSPAYLQQQFLCASGRIEYDEARLSIRLDHIPLNIVLQMAGFSPWQQRLPWLEVLLTLEVAE